MFIKKLSFYIYLLIFLQAIVFSKGVYYSLNEEKTDFPKDAKMVYRGSNFQVIFAESTKAESRNFFNPELEAAYLIYLPEKGRSEYLDYLEKFTSFVTVKEDHLIALVHKDNVPRLYPAVHGGLIRLFDRSIKELREVNIPQNIAKNELILEVLGKIEMDSVACNIQHLEDYGTRDTYTESGKAAGDWLKAKMESYGLKTSFHDFPMPGGESCDNVIGIKRGKLYPDEYLVIGGHYDSVLRSYLAGDAPGADDNASGTAGVLEAARILKDYELERSVIFCAFAGEEYGLYGSKAYANYLSENSVNVLAYFNLDMIGYLKSGADFNTTLIYPAGAKPLADYYKEIAEVYVPQLEITDGSLSGGDSDHTSFNNNGFMGIYPFEDSENYSPYIHTPEDLFGTSVNDLDYAKTMLSALLSALTNWACVTKEVILPEDFKLYQNYPNPFNPETIITFTLAKPENVKLAIYNAKGIFIRELLNQRMKAGKHTVSFKFKKHNSGVYFCRMKAGSYIQTRKITLCK